MVKVAVWEYKKKELEDIKDASAFVFSDIGCFQDPADT